MVDSLTTSESTKKNKIFKCRVAASTSRENLLPLCIEYTPKAGALVSVLCLPKQIF